MSDVNEWISERRRIHARANNVLLRNSYEVEREIDSDAFVSDDTDAIVDAHNTLPALLTAVEKVLELHKRGKDGKCVECFHMYHGDWYAYRVAYPCPTVRAIEGAINE